MRFTTILGLGLIAASAMAQHAHEEELTAVAMPLDNTTPVEPASSLKLSASGTASHVIRPQPGDIFMLLNSPARRTDKRLDARFDCWTYAPKKIGQPQQYIYTPGPCIHNIVKNSPAYQAGLRQADFIWSVNGKIFNDLTVAERYQELNHGIFAPITIMVKRDGKLVEKAVRLQWGRAEDGSMLGFSVDPRGVQRSDFRPSDWATYQAQQAAYEKRRAR